MSQQYRHSVSVSGIVVRDDGRILVIRRRDNGHYQAPGGILEADEQLQAGLIREVAEETGLQVEPLQLTGVYKHMKLGVVALVFRCRLLGGTPTVNDEATDVTWLDHETVVSVMSEAFAIRVTDALHGPWPQVRHHDGTSLLTTSNRSTDAYELQ